MPNRKCRLVPGNALGEAFPGGSTTEIWQAGQGIGWLGWRVALPAHAATGIF